MRADKRDHIDNLTRHAEVAAAQRNMKDLYIITRKLAGRYQQTDKQVKNKQGRLLTSAPEAPPRPPPLPPPSQPRPDAT